MMFPSFANSGKRIISLKDYQSILMNYSTDDDYATINKLGMHTSANENDMVAVAYNNKSFGFLPGLEFCNT